MTVAWSTVSARGYQLDLSSTNFDGSGVVHSSRTRNGELGRLTIAGLEAIELLATATDTKTEQEVLVYQVLVVEPQHGGYTRILGIVNAADRERYLPVFRSVTQSFQPNGR